MTHVSSLRDLVRPARRPYPKGRHIMSTIGLIGAGHIGSQVARLAAQHGYDVVISNSRGPETLEKLVAELGPHARAATPAEAAAAGDIVVVTIPLKNYREVPADHDRWASRRCEGSTCAGDCR